MAADFPADILALSLALDLLPLRLRTPVFLGTLALMAVVATTNVIGALTK